LIATQEGEASQTSEDTTAESGPTLSPELSSIRGISWDEDPNTGEPTEDADGRIEVSIDAPSIPLDGFDDMTEGELTEYINEANDFLQRVDTVTADDSVALSERTKSAATNMRTRLQELILARSRQGEMPPTPEEDEGGQFFGGGDEDDGADQGHGQNGGSSAIAA
jgi:hypothetical protein